MPPMIMANR